MTGARAQAGDTLDSVIGRAENAAAHAELAAAEARAAGDPFQNFYADGLTSDDDNFAKLEANIRDHVLDLQGRSFLVLSIPTGNRYSNGYFKIDARRYDSGESDSIIASFTDTGGTDDRYAGGVQSTPTVSGRTTRKMNGILWSENCRSSRLPRNGTIASIYSWITSLVGLILAGRQSYATQPQSIIAGCEESFIDSGSRNSVISSIFSVGEGVGASVIGSRSSRASGWEAGVLGSNACVAGAGSGARFQVNVNASGAISSVTILAGGSGYIDPTVDITDRVGTGSGATARVTITDGVVSAVAITNGGAGYSRDPNAVNFHLFTRRSVAVVGSNKSSARGNASFIGGAANSDTTGNQTAVLASNRGTASGSNSAVIASGPASGGNGSTDSVASGNNSLIAASSSSSASGMSSVALAATLCSVSATRAIVSGRRTINNVDDSWTAGTNGSGPPSAANRKIHVHYGNGNVEIAGVLSQNKIFTDIAKMFENATPGIAIPVGALVSLDGRKLRLADAGDTFFSVHTRTYVQLLGDTAFTWAGRYLHDDHGEILTQDILDPDWSHEVPDPKWPVMVINPAHPVIEELCDDQGNPALDESGKQIRYVISQQMIPNPIAAPMIKNPLPQPMVRVPIENPDYNPAHDQVPRSTRRDEWTPMLLQGEAFMHVTEDVLPGDYIEPVAPGIGGKTLQSTAFLCMEIMTPFDAEKGYAIALALRT